VGFCGRRGPFDADKWLSLFVQEVSPSVDYARLSVTHVREVDLRARPHDPILEQRAHRLGLPCFIRFAESWECWPQSGLEPGRAFFSDSISVLATYLFVRKKGGKSMQSTDHGANGQRGIAAAWRDRRLVVGARRPLLRGATYRIAVASDRKVP